MSVSTPRGWIWIRLCGKNRSRCLPWSLRIPLRTLTFLGITLQYEMCYTNVLQLLDLAQIPLHACDRTEEDPIVIGGGPCTYNPEPIAEFFDHFLHGRGRGSLL